MVAVLTLAMTTLFLVDNNHLTLQK